jgi:hypothetical protein
MPRTTRQALREAQPSRWTQLKRSNCPNTEGGVSSHGTLGMVADQALPARGEDAWGRAPKLAGRPPAEGLLPPGEGETRGAGQEDLVRGPATHQHCRPASGQLSPRFQEGRGRSGWYHHRRGDLPPAHHPHLDEAAGAGSDRAGEVEVSKGQLGCSLRAGFLPLTQGECWARCS